MPLLMIGPMLDHAMTRVPKGEASWEKMTQILANHQPSALEIILKEAAGAVSKIQLSMAGGWGKSTPNYVLLGRVGKTWILEHGRADEEIVQHHVHVGMLPETTLQPLRGAALTGVIGVGPVTAEFWPADTQIEYAGKLFERFIRGDEIRTSNLHSNREFEKAHDEHWLMFDVTAKSRKQYANLR